MVQKETGLCVKLLVALGDRNSPQWLPVTELLDEVGLSRSHANKLVRRLTELGYLETRRGVGGGLRLAENARTATVRQLATDLNEDLVDDTCFLDGRKCKTTRSCPVHATWLEQRKAIAAMLNAPIFSNKTSSPESSKHPAAKRLNVQ